MIRSEDLRHYIATLRDVIAGPVMNDLQSAPVRELTGVVLTLLDRIQTDLVAGDAIAGAALPEWQRLRPHAARIVGRDIATAPSGGWQGLEQELARVQEALADGDRFERFVGALRDDRDGARDWMRDMTGLLARLTREFENRFSPPAAAGAAAPPPPDDRAAQLRQRLAAYLARRFPALPADPIEAFAIVSGGQSKLSALLTLRPNTALPRYLALRLDIPNTSTPLRLDTEYPVLQRVHELGLPVPAPLLFEPDPHYLGGAFLLSDQVRDASIGGSPFVEDRRKHGAATAADFGHEAAQLLATLHSRTYEPDALDDEVARERDVLLAGLAEDWRGMAKTPFTLQRDLAIAWLQAHPLPPGRPVCLVHGDFAQHNILTRDGRIAALLDWELARRGDPAEDLAQCKMMLIGGTIAWDDFLHVYHAHGGPAAASDPHAVAFYAVLLYLKHGVYQTKIRNQFVRGGGADIKGAIISGHFVDRLALYQAEALRDALEVFGH